MSQPAGAQQDLVEEIKNTLSSDFTPLSFFVSWHGVLTLAYRGFPMHLENLKIRMASLYRLPPENPGSKWPKTSLAAVQNDRRITPDEYNRLNEICKSETERLFGTEGSFTVPARSLGIATYSTRNLEDLITLNEVELRHEPNDLTAEVTPQQAENVQRVLNEADDANYWFSVSKDGSRIKHYKEYAPGCTLMVPLGKSRFQKQEKLLAMIRSFRKVVEEQFPGLYSWFSEESLHITLRSLMG